MLMDALEYLYESGDWYSWEEGVWVLSIPMRMLEQCYYFDDEEWRVFGSTEDFTKVAEQTRLGFVIIDAESLRAHVIQSEGGVQTMTITQGLRHLRASPQLVGILKLEGRLAMVQAKLNIDERREGVRNVQERMALAILKTKGTKHVGFW